MEQRGVRLLVSSSADGKPMRSLKAILTSMETYLQDDYCGTDAVSACMVLYTMAGQDSMVHRLGNMTTASQHKSLTRKPDGVIGDAQTGLPRAEIFLPLSDAPVVGAASGPGAADRPPSRPLATRLRASLTWLLPVLTDADLSDEEIDLLLRAMHKALDGRVHTTAEHLERAAGVGQLAAVSRAGMHLAGILKKGREREVLAWLLPGMYERDAAAAAAAAMKDDDDDDDDAEEVDPMSSEHVLSAVLAAHVAATMTTKRRTTGLNHVPTPRAARCHVQRVAAVLLLRAAQWVPPALAHEAAKACG